MEYWKQILTRRQYTIEHARDQELGRHRRPRDVRDRHRSCNPVAIADNHRPCFTLGKEDPTPNKYASSTARSLLRVARPTRRRPRRIRPRDGVGRRRGAHQLPPALFLTAFVSSVMRVDAARPVAADQMWNEGDTMLQREHNMREPRRMGRRKENCKTMAVWRRSRASTCTSRRPQTLRPASRSRGGHGQAIRDWRPWDVVRVASVPTR